jgi:hypothetical protein
MDEERTPDLAGENYKELEEKVKKMLDPLVDDDTEDASFFASTVEAAKKTEEAVVDKEIPSAPQVTTPSKSKKSKKSKTTTKKSTEAKEILPGPPDLPMDKAPLKIEVLKDDGEGGEIEPNDNQEDEAPKTSLKKKPKKKADIQNTATASSQKIEATEAQAEPGSGPEMSDKNTEAEQATAEDLDGVPEVKNIDPDFAEDSKPKDEDIEASDEEFPDEITDRENLDNDLAAIADKTLAELHQKNSKKEKIQDDIDDPEIDRAVDEIVKKESDELLAAQDNLRTSSSKKISKAKPHKPSIFTKKGFWIGVGVSLVLALVVAAIVPTIRYAALNMIGLRTRVTLSVRDASTGQPLRGVTAYLAGETAKTDKNGNAEISSVKLGRHDMRLEKLAFAPIESAVTASLGANDYGEFSLEPTGLQLELSIQDYISGSPLQKAEVVYGESSALSDEKGRAVLTIDADVENDEEITVSVILDKYRQEMVAVALSGTQAEPVRMVPSLRHVYVSERNNKYDVYSSFVDGLDETIILPATGFERRDVRVIPHPSKNFVAVVSSRDNARNQQGRLLDTLTLVDVSTKDAVKLTQSENIQIIGWSGDYFVYQELVNESSQNAADRHKLMSYNVASKNTIELAAARLFNAVLMVNDVVYYAPSGLGSSSQKGLYTVQPNGANKSTKLEEEVWSVFRTDYDLLTIATARLWFELSPSSGDIQTLPGDPIEPAARTYVDAVEKKHSIWVTRRDGQGTIMLRDVAQGTERPFYAVSGLRPPVRWLNEHSFIFRVESSSETADYMMSIWGGTPQKIVDSLSPLSLGDRIFDD